MSDARPAANLERLLRWYPAVWRARYGAELVALMEDTYGNDPVPARSRFGIARAGMTERLVEMGLGTGNQGPAERLRGGALLVLCAWGFFVIGGSIFAKAAEGWALATSHADRALPGAGYDSVVVAAAVGAVVIAVAAVVTLPAFLRFLGAGGWSDVRRPVRVAVGVSAVTMLTVASMSLWAHHLDYSQRNGGSLPYEVLALVVGILAMVTIAAWTVATLRTVRLLDLSAPVLRLEGRLALLLALVMLVIVGGTSVWWAAEAADAPRFLSGSTSGPVGSALPPNLLIAGAFMVAGVCVALRGALRVGGALRSRSSAAG
ncbi:MAG TPA: hypothetical protein VN796_00490 [Acidimicrobiales bacterium]|nr:hypothetical protein [Acidimicrobiales bacterium]